MPEHWTASGNLRRFQEKEARDFLDFEEAGLAITKRAQMKPLRASKATSPKI